jgi:hypothetical protein
MLTMLMVLRLLLLLLALLRHQLRGSRASQQKHWCCDCRHLHVRHQGAQHYRQQYHRRGRHPSRWSLSMSSPSSRLLRWFLLPLLLPPPVPLLPQMPLLRLLPLPLAGDAGARARSRQPRPPEARRCCHPAVRPAPLRTGLPGQMRTLPARWAHCYEVERD